MPKELSPDHPNLVSALNRMRRMSWAWAGLSLLFGVLTLGTLGSTYPLAAAPWFIHALLLILNQQPSFLALTAVLWGISLMNLLPGVSNLVGPDPLTVIFETSVVEKIAFGVVRFLLLLMAWNQFMFYRMLYGTARASGLANELPAIPELIENKNDALARIGQIVGFIGLLAVWGSTMTNTDQVRSILVGLAYIGIVFSIGLGFGVIFSPTTRRRVAMYGVGIGILTFFSLNFVGRI
jgi:hypothetical protein